jgi:hypothetical protein
MNATAQATQSNFAFLAKRYPQLERIGALSERYFSDDPIISLITIRQFGEGLAQLVAARSGIFTDANEPQADLLRPLRVDGNLTMFTARCASAGPRRICESNGAGRVRAGQVTTDE